MSEQRLDIGGPSRGMDGGWRPDPTGRFPERFFDGWKWTERVRMDDAVAVDTGHDLGDHDGWYEDPTGRFPGRYFDGRAWTKRVRVADAVATDTVGAPSDCSPPRGAERAPVVDGRSPGWYPDPGGDESWPHWDPPREGPDKQRYWDGHRWTAKTRVGGGHELSWLQQPFVRVALRRAIVALVALAAVVALLVIVVW